MKTLRRLLTEMDARLEHLEDRVDAIHFQLFEERTHRTSAERYFDERRQDPDYDQAYRQTWRALQDAERDDSYRSGPADR